MTNFISVDIETSVGADNLYDENPGVILQIAMVDYQNGESLNCHLRYDKPIVCDPQAFAVNKVDVSSLNHGGPLNRTTPWKVEIDFEQWLQKPVRENPIAFGLNVGGFDIPFIKRQMPHMAKLLGYRNMDLNAVTMGHSLSEKPYHLEDYDGKDWLELKKGLTADSWGFIKEFKPEFANPHDALSDAMFNCVLLSNLTDNWPGWLSEWGSK